MNKNLINNYIEKIDWRVKENSNETFSISGLQSYIAGEILAEDYIVKSPIGNLHREKKVHIHDAKFGEFSPYCIGLDFYKLASIGLINPTGTSSRPAHHFDSLMSQMVNMLYISQQEFAGAQAFSNVDTIVAPFIAKDNLTYSEVKQIVQRSIYDINYPLRSGYQTPFINWSFDITCPKYMEDQGVIIGGQIQDTTYNDYQEEMDLFNIVFLDCMMEGNMEKPFTFPIPTYTVTPDFPWTSSVVDKIFQLTAKFGLPYFLNTIGSDIDPDETRSLCCRLSLNMKDLNKMMNASKGGLWNTGASTGSLAVTTINLPQLGYLSRNIDDFYEELEYLLEMCYEHHEWKREKVEWALEQQLLPFTSGYLQNFNSFFSTVGTIGINEMCMNMFNSTIDKEISFVKDVLRFIIDKCTEFTYRSGHLYNMEEIPAEGLCYTFALHDKTKYPDCYTQGDGENVYYTNSSHNPVDHDLTPIEDILIQSNFKDIYNGGTLHHLFMGEAYPNSKGVKELIKSICENTKIPYLAFTKSYAICEFCGMTDDLTGICPNCGEDTDIFSRVTGYYRPISKYNKGKLSEFKDRKQLRMDEF